MRHLLASLCLILPLFISAQEKWDVSAPSGDWNWETTSFTTTEGTWMSLDLSPDGKTIAFDMLGDIYTLPIEGGKAKPVRTGIPWEVQPRRQALALHQ